MPSSKKTHANNRPTLTAVRILAPLVCQSNGYTCGVAALQSVLHYYGYSVRADMLSEALCADPVHGTNYHHMVAFAGECGIGVSVFFEMDLDTLRKLLDDGMPVIVALQAWAENPARSYLDNWEDGHYAVVVGYDDECFYFMDPSTLGNYTYIPSQEFLERWHDCYEDAGEVIRLSRFGMAFSGPEVRYAPDRVVPMR